MRIFKWILILLLIVLVSTLSYRLLTMDATNARVAQEIKENPSGPRAARSMLLYLADGTMYPVNYLHEDNTVYVGIDGLWWREFRGEGAPVSLLIQGQAFTGHGKVVLDDPAFVADVFSRLRPTVPKWLPDWLNGKLVVIKLHTES